MQHHDAITTEARFAPPAPPRLVHGVPRGRPSRPYRDSVHGRAALAAAVEDGLLAEEVEDILDGRSVVQAFPVRWGESPPAYAARAVSEMMVAYLR